MPRILMTFLIMVTSEDVNAGIVTNEDMFNGKCVARFTSDDRMMELLIEETNVAIVASAIIVAVIAYRKVMK